MKFIFSLLRKLFGQNIYHILPFFIVVLYLPQAFVGIIYYGEEPALTLLISIVLSLFFYYLAYYLFFFLVASRIKNLYLPVNFSSLFTFISFTYAVLIIYTSITAPSIALVDAILGKTPLEIAAAREYFIKARDEVFQTLNYFYVTYTKTLMPFLTVYVFYRKYKFRRVFLILFLFSLWLTLEKSLAVSAMLPLLGLFLLQKDMYRARLALSTLLFFIVINSFLARGDFFSTINIPKFNVHTNSLTAYLFDERNRNSSLNFSTDLSSDFGIKIHKFEFLKTILSNSDIPHKSYAYSNYSLKKVAFDVDIDLGFRTRNIFVEGFDDSTLFLINRIVWIPYITAFDWLRYWEEVLDSKFLYGRSINGIAWLTGQQSIRLEKEVFGFQFGQTESGSGSANTLYSIDGFVNFGFIGVIVYSSIIGIISAFILSSDSIPAKMVYILHLYSLSFSSLPAILFSGGLMVLVLVSRIKPSE